MAKSIEESNKKLQDLCLEIVSDFISCAVKSGIIKREEAKDPKKVLTKLAKSSTYNQDFPDAAGAGSDGIWLGENIRKSVDDLKSVDDPIFMDGSGLRKILFHEFTHILQIANLNKENNGEMFTLYKNSANSTMGKGFYSCLQEIAASLAEQHLWSSLNNKNDKVDLSKHYYAHEIKLGLDLLKSIDMTETDLIRATIIKPELFEIIGIRYNEKTKKNFADFLKSIDEKLLLKHTQDT